MSSATSSPPPSQRISPRKRFAACCSSARAASRSAVPLLEERLALRVPRVSRVMAGAVGALPPNSSVRRRAVDRIVRGGYASVERRDLDSLLVRYSPDVRYHAAPQHVAMGGFDAIYHGHEGVRKYLGSWMDTWEEMRFELQEISDRGDVVMVLEDFYGRPHGTSAELKERQGRVVRLQRGLVVEEHWLMSWEETRRLAAQLEG